MKKSKLKRQLAIVLESVDTIFSDLVEERKKSDFLAGRFELEESARGVAERKVAELRNAVGDLSAKVVSLNIENKSLREERDSAFTEIDQKIGIICDRNRLVQELRDENTNVRENLAEHITQVVNLEKTVEQLRSAITAACRS